MSAPLVTENLALYRQRQINATTILIHNSSQVFKEAAKEFCEEFYETAPVSSDVSAKDALAQLKAFRDQLNALRAQEQLIRDGLAVFNLT